MRIAFENHSDLSGPSIHFNSSTAPEMHAICQRAVFGLVGPPVTADALRDALLAAIENLRADVLAAEIVEVTPRS